MAFRRLGCLTHGKQLVVKLVYDGKYHGLFLKTGGLVGEIRKSSVISEKIVDKSDETMTATVLQVGTTLILWFGDFWRSGHLSTKYLMT